MNTEKVNYECDLCTKVCTSIGGLKLHKLKKHGAEKDAASHIIEFSVEKLLIEACNKEIEKCFYPEK